MVNTRTSRRLSYFLALGLVAAGGLALVSPASAQQGRFRVLIPNLERQGDIDEDFGEDVVKELRKLIDDLPTHAPVEDDELEDALDRYDLDKDELTCTQSRQLAAQSGFELVMCGEYAAVAGGMEVKATFISAKDQVSFEVPPVTAAEPEQAAQQIFSAFEGYVNLLRLVTFCNQDLASQQWQNALGRCEQALAIDPKQPSALYGKGYALMKLGQLEGSLEALEQVLAVSPAHQEALNAAGYVTAKLEQNDKSRQYYRRYLELNPDNIQVRLKVATEAATAGDPEGALQITEAGIHGDSVDLTLAEYAGYFAMNAAAELAQPAAGQDSGSQQGPAPEVAAFYEKALGYFDRVLAVKRDSIATNVWVQKLAALTNLKRTQEAVDFGVRAVAARPAEVGLWNAYASALKDAGRIDDALAALDSALVRDPEASNVRALQGQWLVQAGQVERAREAFRLAIQREEIESNAAALSILSIGFNNQFKQKQYDAALPYFEAALEFASDANTQSMAHFFIGYVLFERGIKVQEPATAASAQEALPIFQKALGHFQQGRAYGQQSQGANYQQFLDNTQQYIEIQNALIKRG